jgi:hypothetical protein
MVVYIPDWRGALCPGDGLMGLAVATVKEDSDPYVARILSRPPAADAASWKCGAQSHAGKYTAMLERFAWKGCLRALKPHHVALHCRQKRFCLRQLLHSTQASSLAPLITPAAISRPSTCTDTKQLME